MATKRKHPEQDLQIAIVKWFRLQYPKVLLHHSASGGKRSQVEAAIFKAMGVVPGVADLMLLYKGEVHFFELKAPKGRQSDTQKEFEAYCKEHGFPYYLIDNFEDFQSTIRDILPARK